jgi:acetyltransferase
MLRVFDIGSMFDGVQTIARMKPLRGERLAVLANNTGPGLLAVDMLAEQGGAPASISRETFQAMAGLFLPLPTDNPVCLAEGASPDDWEKALRALLADDGVDAVLAMHSPSALADGLEVAARVAEVGRKSKRNVLASWLGGTSAEASREIFAKAEVPAYPTSDRAVRSFMHLVHYRRNQEMLVQTPASLPTGFEPDTTTVRLVVENALAAKRSRLSVPEAMDVLAAYAVPAVETRVAATIRGAVAQAEALGFPVALKVLSEDIRRKTRAGGVALDVDNALDMHEAAQAMVARVGQLAPGAHLAGFIVQKMSRRPEAFELFVRAEVDPVFGPFLRFGAAGRGEGRSEDRKSVV